MKKFIFIALTSLVCWGGKAQTSEPDYPFRNAHLSASERTEDLISRMTLEEKIDLLAGYNDFYLHPCARLGIPAFRMADGPLGVASWGLWGRATAFPAALSVAASWNRDLAYRIGEMYAAEWRARGLHFMLAPGVNIYRASKGARNFEYYGEDPVLTSQMIVPFIQTVQKGGVIATVKHFAGNDQEFDRYTVSTEVSRRALHEIYLRPFRAAVEEAGVKAVMTGYNPLNGTYCTENKWLIDVLKKDWGFKGMLMSDWACTYSADKAANNGLDLEMGSKDWFNRQRLLPLIKNGTVSEATINDKVRRIYGTCIEMGFFDRDQRIDTIPLYNPAASRMALKGAEEGMVLLKNSNLLPLKSPRRIAVIGRRPIRRSSTTVHSTPTASSMAAVEVRGYTRGMWSTIWRASKTSFRRLKSCMQKGFPTSFAVGSSSRVSSKRPTAARDWTLAISPSERTMLPRRQPMFSPSRPKRQGAKPRRPSLPLRREKATPSCAAPTDR